MAKLGKQAATKIAAKQCKGKKGKAFRRCVGRRAKKIKRNG